MQCRLSICLGHNLQTNPAAGFAAPEAAKFPATGEHGRVPDDVIANVLFPMCVQTMQA